MLLKAILTSKQSVLGLVAVSAIALSASSAEAGGCHAPSSYGGYYYQRPYRVVAPIRPAPRYVIYQGQLHQMQVLVSGNMQLVPVDQTGQPIASGTAITLNPSGTPIASSTPGPAPAASANPAVIPTAAASANSAPSSAAPTAVPASPAPAATQPAGQIPAQPVGPSQPGPAPAQATPALPSPAPAATAVPEALTPLLGLWETTKTDANGVETKLELNLESTGDATLGVTTGGIGPVSMKRRFTVENGQFQLVEGDQKLTLGEVLSADKDRVVLKNGGDQIVFTRP